MKTSIKGALFTLAAAALTDCSSGQEFSYGSKADGNDLTVTALRVEQGITAEVAALKNAEQYAGRTHAISSSKPRKAMPKGPTSTPWAPRGNSRS